MMTKFGANRVFILNNPHAPRLCPELAVEIGLNESILLLQFEFLIAISNNEIDGRRWTYQSITDLEQMFPFWSRGTINRTIHSLEEKGLIVVANYNKHRYDKTRWFALNMDAASDLKSVTLCLYQNGTGSNQNGTGSNQNGTGSNQNGTGSNQNGTTIPETTTETTPDTIPGEAKNASPGGGEISSPENRVAHGDGPAEEKTPGSGDEKPKREIKRSSREIAIDHLQEFFAERSGIPVEPDHKARTKMWRGPLGRLLDSMAGDVKKTRDLIAMAINRMRKDNLTFSSPSSIYKVALALIPELKTEGNGRRVHAL